MATKDKVITPGVTTDPWKEMRKIKPPRARNGEDGYIYLAVNGVRMQAPRGKESEVPLPLYEVYMQSQDAQDVLDDYRAEIPNDCK